MLQRRTRQRLIFLAIVCGYAGMQWFALHAVYQGLALRAGWLIPMIAWALLMTFAPFLLWRLEHAGRHRLATAGAWLSYGWMGMVFLYFWVALVLDLFMIVTGNTLGGSETNRLLLALLLTLGIAAYGVLAAMVPRVERIAVRSPKFPSGRKPLRIVMISDVHLGALVGARALRRILKRLTALNADIVVSTGDLVDGQADRLRGLFPLLAALQPPLGKYAVIGNHECYVGLAHALDFHARAGFTVLRGSAVAVTPELSIAGVDDPAAANLGERAGQDERAALAGIAAHNFTLLLKHQPVVTPDGAPRADLQLSGHVHQGQIFPFNLLVRLVYRRPMGLSVLPGGAHLYVSRGTGTWGPPMRVLAPPEITLIELGAA